MNNKHQPFIAITCCFALGILIQSIKSEMVPVACGLLVICFLISMKYVHRPNVSTLFLLLAISAIAVVYSASRQSMDQNHISHVAQYYRTQPVTLQGIIISDIQHRQSSMAVKQMFTLNVEEIQTPWGWEQRSGKILVNDFSVTDVSYGELIQIEGRLHRPYNFSSDTHFSYRDYLRHRGIHYLLSVKKNSNVHVLEKGRGNVIKLLSLNLRDHLASILTSHLSKNEAGIMKAILLGDRSGIIKPVRELFVQTGTAHILAISGLHIGVVAGLFLIISKFCPCHRRWRLGSVIILLIGYAFLTGGRPSVVRATIMMIVFLGSLILEKEPEALNTLFLAAMLILVYNPLNLFDVGFQLSFVCVFSIIYVNLTFLRNNKKDHGHMHSRYEHMIGQSLFVSLAIWIAVAGFIAYYFGIITPITVLANLLIVPLISMIVTLGFGLLLISAIYPAWSVLFAACLKCVLNVMVGIIFLLDKLPMAYFYIRDVKLSYVFTYYGVLIVILGLIGLHRRKYPEGIDKTMRV